MGPDRNDSEGIRELRLEGVGLVVLGGVLIAGIAGSFFFGRWYERQFAPTPQAGIMAEDPLEHVVEAGQPTDVEQSADFFDTIAGEKQAEPQREIEEPKPETRAAARPTPEAVVPAGGRAPAKRPGDYWVQVFAGRERRSAEAQFSRVKSSGFEAEVFTEKDGSDTLFKVRVGGYVTEDEARLAAGELQKRGYTGAWVTRVDP